MPPRQGPAPECTAPSVHPRNGAPLARPSAANAAAVAAAAAVTAAASVVDSAVVAAAAAAADPEPGKPACLGEQPISRLVVGTQLPKNQAKGVYRNPPAAAGAAIHGSAHRHSHGREHFHRVRGSERGARAPARTLYMAGLANSHCKLPTCSFAKKKTLALLLLGLARGAFDPPSDLRRVRPPDVQTGWGRCRVSHCTAAQQRGIGAWRRESQQRWPRSECT